MQDHASEPDYIFVERTGDASSPTTSAAASSTSHTRPGGDSPLEEEPYEVIFGSWPKQSPSPKDATAMDQPRQTEDVSEWAPGTKVIGRYNFPGSVAHVSACDVIILSRYV